MKTLLKVLMATTAMTGLVHAAMLVGDTIAVNITATGTTAGGNWNNIASEGGTNFGAMSGTLGSNFLRWADGTNSGVGLDYSITPGATDDITIMGIAGLISPIDNLAAFPIVGSLPSEVQSRMSYHNIRPSSFIFTGLELEPGVTGYNVSFQSWTEATARNSNNFDIIGASTTSVSVDPNNSPSVYTVFGVVPNASGQIIISSKTTGSGAGNQHINAMEITAIPEPGTLVLVGVALGSLLLFRRRK